MIYVVRHGQTVWNQERRLQGRSDSVLTRDGTDQAHRMGQWLANAGVDQFALWSSPQGRARQTADIVATETDLRVVIVEDLAEMGVGDWEGQTVDELTAKGAGPRDDESALDWCARAPNGEGLPALRHRAQAVLQRLETPSILVCHGLLSRVLRAEWLGVPEHTLDGGQGVIYRLAKGRMDRIQP